MRIWHANRAWTEVPADTTDHVLIPAVAGHRIRVFALTCLTGGTATAFRLNSKGAGAGTAISPSWPNGPNGGLVQPLNEAGWYETLPGQALTCTTGAGATTAVHVLYGLYPG